MKPLNHKKKYKFRFASGNIEVYALNETEAEILAKAEAIKKGWNYKILRENVEQMNIFIDWERLTEEERATFYDLLEKGRPDKFYKEEN